MRRTLILFLLLAAAAMPLAAQSLSGTVSGTVKDDQGGVLPGVAVTLAGKTGTRTATSDAQSISVSMTPATAKSAASGNSRPEASALARLAR